MPGSIPSRGRAGLSGLLEWSLDGQKLFLAVSDRLGGRQIRIHTLNLPKLEEIKREETIKEASATIKLDTLGFSRIAMGPQARRIAIGEQKRTKARGGNLDSAVIRIIDLGTGKVLNTFDQIERRGNGNLSVTTLAWKPDGFMIAAGLDDGTIRVFKTPK